MTKLAVSISVPVEHHGLLNFSSICCARSVFPTWDDPVMIITIFTSSKRKSAIQPFFSLVYLSSMLKMDAYVAYSEDDPCREQQRIPSVDRQQQNYYDRKGRSRHGNAQKT